jgi:hypothetical protein
MQMLEFNTMEQKLAFESKFAEELKSGPSVHKPGVTAYLRSPGLVFYRQWYVELQPAESAVRIQGMQPVNYEPDIMAQRTGSWFLPASECGY